MGSGSTVNVKSEYVKKKLDILEHANYGLADKTLNFKTLKGQIVGRRELKGNENILEKLFGEMGVLEKM